jgi:hypothetical protein
MTISPFWGEERDGEAIPLQHLMSENVIPTNLLICGFPLLITLKSPVHPHLKILLSFGIAFYQSR